MRIFKQSTFLIIFILIGNISFANITINPDSVKKDPLNKKVLIGGTASLNFGRYYDAFDIQPYLGINISQRFYFGIGASYSYLGYEMEVNEQMQKQKDNYFGVGCFMGYYPFESQKHVFLNNIYIQADYELLQSFYKLNSENSDIIDNSFSFPLIGLGYKNPISKKLKLVCYLGFVLSSKDYLPYSNPIISLGLEF